MSTNPSPQYLIIGHVTKDNTPTGPILGGTCSYSALTAHKLGQRTAAVTSYGPDIPSLAGLAGIVIEAAPAEQSTTFENVYQEGVRYQKWLASSAQLSLANVPAAWRDTPIVHLAPIAQEMWAGVYSYPLSGRGASRKNCRHSAVSGNLEELRGIGGNSETR